jgi:F-type H+-transporting ATPase subunit c
MSKFRMLLFAVIGILATGMTVFAQGVGEAAAAGDNVYSVNKYRAIAAGIGFAIAVFGGALGQSRIGAAACEGAARNPGAAGRIQTMMILGLALIESLVLFALLVIFAVVKGVVT